MTLSSYNDKRLEENGLHEDEGQLKKGQHIVSPDKKLLSGTIQFYENVLDSFGDLFIAIFNESGKHIEVWSSPEQKEIFGINPFEFKGRFLEESYDKQTAQTLQSLLNHVFKTASKQSDRIEIKFPNNTFWFKITLTPLNKNGKAPTNIVCFFQNITEIIRLEEKIQKLRSKEKPESVLSDEESLLLNHKGIVISVSHSLLNISGYSKDDFIGFKYNKIPVFQENYLQVIQSVFDAGLAGKKSGTLELKWKTFANRTIWTEVMALPTQDTLGPRKVKFLFKDISERKFLENELLKSKQAYKIIIENASEAIFILQDGLVKFSNSRLMDMVDNSLDELLNSPFINFLHPDDREKFNKIISGHKHEFSEIPTNLRLLKKDKSFYWIEVKSVFIDWDTKPATLLYFTDISARKSKEENAKQELLEYRTLSEKALDFGTLTSDEEIFSFTAKKIIELPSVSAVLLISYDGSAKSPRIEHIEGADEIRQNLMSIINSNVNEFAGKINHDLIKNISYGKLIKYNDGLFEHGHTIFPKNTFNLIQKVLNVSGIYLIGFTHEETVFGTALIFTPEGKKLENPGVIETIAKLTSSSLARKQKLDNLRLSEQKYRRVFESYQDIYFQTDTEGVILEVSPSVKNILGYEPKEVEGKLINNFFNNDLLLSSLIKNLIKNEYFSDKDIELVCKDGTSIFASLSASILRDDKNRPLGFEGFIRDISERKNAEEMYQQSEEKFRTFADFTYDWEYWISPDGNIIYMSPSCHRISGFNTSEFHRNPDLLFDIIHNDDHEAVKEAYKTFTGNSKKVLQLDFRITTKDKQVKWISQICREVKSETGDLLGLRVSNRDITGRKLADEELKNSEERFKTLFIDSPDAVFVEDYDGFILDVNPAACALHSIERDKLIGQNIINLVPSENQDEVTKMFPKWISGELKNIRSFLATLKGKVIPVEIHGNKINYSGKDALLFIVRDITEIVEKEKQLKESAKKAEEADMLKSAFLANVSHEIRTPMNAIIGFSEILTNPDLTQKEREEFIHYITQGSNTLMTLIEDIIDITKIEAGQIKIDFDDCNVDELLDELYATFLKMKNKDNKPNLEIRMNKPAAERGFIISTDPHRIRQILSNLLGNALKFTKEGFIEFGYTLKGSDNIEFYVKDTGIGIPENKIQIIFERFGQVDSHRNMEQKGTGLGLSISKKLAELLGGDLSVNSEEGAGSTFFLNLPVYKETRIKKQQDSRLVSKSIDWSDKVFLIAEDSILNYTFLDALFQKTHVKLLWAKNGKEAVDQCKENPDIDLVLMDIKMPVLDGLEAIRQIKKFRNSLPIIVQTAYAMPEDRDRSLAAGGDEHLTKPINADELFSTISKYLN